MRDGGAGKRATALQAIFEHLSTPPGSGAGNMIDVLRSHAETYAMGQSGKGLTACAEIPVRVGSIEARWFVPPDARPDRRLIHLHGGGWVAGSINSHRALAAELAWLSGAPVLLPAYRLAPEHPFPAGLDDALEILKYAQAVNHEGMPARGGVCLSGDSAGGNLAAAVALRCALESIPGPIKLALLSPFLSLEAGLTAFSAPADDPVVQADGIGLVASLYAPLEADADPLVEPLLAPRQLLEKMPPTLIQASAAETLRDQAFAFANLLWSAGNETRLSLWADVPHVWHVFLETLPDAKLALSEAAAFLVAD